MRDIEWDAPAPCYGQTGTRRCHCDPCRAASPTLAWWFHDTGPASMADATGSLLSWLLDDLTDQDWYRTHPDEYPDRVGVVERRLDATYTWLSEHVDIDRSEAVFLAELKETMEADWTRTHHYRSFVREAYLALRLAAGDA